MESVLVQLNCVSDAIVFSGMKQKDLRWVYGPGSQARKAHSLVVPVVGDMSFAAVLSKRGAVVMHGVG